MRSFVLLVSLAVVFGSPAVLQPGSSNHVDASDHKQSRIVNGRDAEPGEIPYQVAIKWINGNSICGGATILTPNWVMTAAHACPTDFVTLKIYTNSLLLSEGGLDFKMAEIIKHPLYNETYHLRNDICLIRLNGSIPLGQNVQPVTLPPQDFEVPDNSPVVASGWGINADDKIPDHLQVSTKLYSVANDRCQEIVPTFPLFEGVICASGESGDNGQGVCSGDSGGPLAYKGAQIGITSIGPSPCGITSWPDWYTRVSHYTSWIQETLGQDAALLKIANASDLLRG